MKIVWTRVACILLELRVQKFHWKTVTLSRKLLLAKPTLVLVVFTWAMCIILLRFYRPWFIITWDLSLLNQYRSFQQISQNLVISISSTWDQFNLPSSYINHVLMCWICEYIRFVGTFIFNLLSLSLILSSCVLYNHALVVSKKGLTRLNLLFKLRHEYDYFHLISITYIL